MAVVRRDLRDHVHGLGRAVRVGPDCVRRRPHRPLAALDAGDPGRLGDSDRAAPAPAAEAPGGIAPERGGAVHRGGALSERLAFLVPAGWAVGIVATLAASALPHSSHSLIESVDALAFLTIAPLALALRSGISRALGVGSSILGAGAHVLYATNVFAFGRSWPAVALFSLAAFVLGVWFLTVRIDRLHYLPAVGGILLGAGFAAAFAAGLGPDQLAPHNALEFIALITFGLGAIGVAFGVP